MNKTELHNFIAKQQPNICQVVAIRDGEEVYRDTWNDYKDEDCTHIMSATKSIMSVAKSLFTRMVYTSGVLNFSPQKNAHAPIVIPVANPTPR